MKKIVLSTFLVVILTIISVVPAFAATHRIGSTSWYYNDDSGFGGGDRGGSYTSVSYSTLNQYLSNVRSAYPSYVYSMTSHGSGNRIVRRFFPKGRSMAKVAQKDCTRAADFMNTMRRRVLDYDTAQNRFIEQLYLIDPAFAKIFSAKCSDGLDN